MKVIAERLKYKAAEKAKDSDGCTRNDVSSGWMQIRTGRKDNFWNRKIGLFGRLRNLLQSLESLLRSGSSCKE